LLYLYPQTVICLLLFESILTLLFDRDSVRFTQKLVSELETIRFYLFRVL